MVENDINTNMFSRLDQIDCFNPQSVVNEKFFNTRFSKSQFRSPKFENLSKQNMDKGYKNSAQRLAQTQIITIFNLVYAWLIFLLKAVIWKY